MQMYRYKMERDLPKISYMQNKACLFAKILYLEVFENTCIMISFRNEVNNLWLHRNLRSFKP